MLAGESAGPSDPSEPPATGRRRRQGGGLGRYILIRFLLIIPTVFILVTLVFFLMRVTGDPITASQGGRLTPSELQVRIHAAGYDRPLLVQYGEYLGGIVRGDFGTSVSDNLPVTQILTTYGSATLELALYALIVAFLVGFPLGRIAAYRARPLAGRVAADLRDPVLRHADLLRGAAAQTGLLGVARMVPHQREGGHRRRA